MPSSNQARRITVVFRNDDPSAVSDVAQERKLFALFERYGVPQTIGVVPNSIRGSKRVRGGERVPFASNPEMVKLLVEHVARTGSELALHGFTHESNRFSNPSRRYYYEFAELPLDEQESLLREGVAMLESTTGFRPRTFIPPWNRLDQNTVRACERVGFEVISTELFVPLSSSVLPFSANSSLPEFHRHLEAAQKSDRHVFIHLLLHTPTMTTSADAQLLEKVLATVTRSPECEVLTIAETARRYRAELAQLNLAGRSLLEFNREVNSVRARAHLYAQSAQRLRLGKGLSESRHSAEQAFRAGDYERCLALDSAQEQWAVKALWGTRAAVIALSVGLAFVARQFLPAQANAISLTVGLLVLILAVVAIARVTSRDTRREILLLLTLAALGWLTGTFLNESSR